RPPRLGPRSPADHFPGRYDDGRSRSGSRLREGRVGAYSALIRSSALSPIQAKRHRLSPVTHGSGELTGFYLNMPLSFRPIAEKKPWTARLSCCFTVPW